MNMKIIVPEGKLERAEFVPMKRCNEQYRKVACKGEPMKCYKRVVERAHWWSKPVSKMEIETVPNKFYEDDVYAPSRITEEIHKHLYDFNFLSNTLHLVEKDGVWYEKAQVYLRADGYGYYNWFDTDEEAIEFFDSLKEKGLTIEINIKR